MTDSHVVGPLKTLSIGGRDAPLYVIPFDKTGILQAPRTLDRVLVDAADGVTDVIVISHGWNTDWNGAVDLYTGFIDAYDAVVQKMGPPHPATKTLVVGVYWPSIALPSSVAPAMAAAPVVDEDPAAVGMLADDVVDPAHRAEFYGLAQAPELTQDQALRLAELLAPLYGRTDDDLPLLLPDDGDHSAIVALWRAAQDAVVRQEGPVIVRGPGGPSRRRPAVDQPGAAGILSAISPSNIIRYATVLTMKDRAGVVGFRGVHTMLARLLAVAGPRVHLVGHSYGCKVLLSATCAAPLARRVRSMLLMQPAMSYLALAEKVRDSGGRGGYEPAKTRCALPIMVTWSRQDVPLRVLFSWAVRRRSDLGEHDIGAAAAPEPPPSRFAAMGGWGPAAEADVDGEKIRSSDGGRYDLGGANEVLALDGTGVITDHGKIVNDATAWALHNLVAQG